MQMVRMVIEVPEGIYQMHKGNDEAFKNAVILPAEHGRLIDADRLNEVFNNTEDASHSKWTLSGVIDEIDDVMTVVPATVPATENTCKHCSYGAELMMNDKHGLVDYSNQKRCCTLHAHEHSVFEVTDYDRCEMFDRYMEKES